MSEITLSQLTEIKLDGTGVFDSLMRAAKDHLEQEFKQNRIKGPEYSQVYLGQLQAILGTSVDFLFQKQRVGLEADLLAKQIELAGIQVQQATKQLDLLDKQILQVTAQTALVEQQRLNAVTENTVLVAQECKLRAEYDLTLQNTLQSAAQTALINQKVATEKAQVLSLGVDDNSVIGKQKMLYQAQTDGFKRDAEQKAAKLYIDVWSARRMTDEGTQANETNGLDEVTMGAVLAALRQGVGITA